MRTHYIVYTTKASYILEVYLGGFDTTYCTLYTIRYTVHTVQCILYSLHYILCRGYGLMAMSVLCCTLFTVHCNTVILLWIFTVIRVTYYDLLYFDVHIVTQHLFTVIQYM